LAPTGKRRCAGTSEAFRRSPHHCGAKMLRRNVHETDRLLNASAATVNAV
jgi:hypothetical protein